MRGLAIEPCDASIARRREAAWSKSRAALRRATRAADGTAHGRMATARVASRSPGTCSESLWLLPSGPDQVHDHAMRGDPPLIGCACGAERGLSADRRSRGKRVAQREVPHAPVAIIVASSSPRPVAAIAIRADHATVRAASRRARCAALAVARRRIAAAVALVRPPVPPPREPQSSSCCAARSGVLVSRARRRARRASIIDLARALRRRERSCRSTRRRRVRRAQR